MRVIYEINDEFNYYKTPKILKKIIKRTLKLEKVNKVMFNIIYVDKQEIRRINKEYRGFDKITDVITFALNDDKSMVSAPINVLGDIYICIDKMIEQAKEYGHSETRELAFLTVHGILHLLGYTHDEKKEEKIMFKKQEEVLNGYKETRR